MISPEKSVRINILLKKKGWTVGKFRLNSEKFATKGDTKIYGVGWEGLFKACVAFDKAQEEKKQRRRQ